MDAIGRLIWVKMTHELLGLKKQGFFPGPVIRILLLDPLGEMRSGVSLVAGVSVVGVGDLIGVLC